MASIDHHNTRALLIGTCEYPEDTTITPIPNIISNLEQLKQTLADESVVGIPESNITVSLNENKSQIERKLRDISENTRDNKYTLLIYYTGHGILSSEDYKLYFTTSQTSKKYLESDSINVDDFKKHIKRSLAGRKIIILDCCHSGALIGAMNNLSSAIQAEIRHFEGTYVMTSAAESEPSLFPVASPGKPTFFTGKFLEILNTGLDVESEYCSLRDIFNKIKNDLISENKPTPQESNFNNADQLYFSINKKFLLRKDEDELAWEKTVEQNTKWAYLSFKNRFPGSKFTPVAKSKIYEIEESEIWTNALKQNTLFHFDDYLEKYPDGKYSSEALAKINNLKKAEENLLWQEATRHNAIEKYNEYVFLFPGSEYAKEAKDLISKLSKIDNEEEMYWRYATNINSTDSFRGYLNRYPIGKYANEARGKIEHLQKMAQVIEKKTTADKLAEAQRQENSRKEKEQQQIKGEIVAPFKKAESSGVDPKTPVAPKIPTSQSMTPVKTTTEKATDDLPLWQLLLGAAIISLIAGFILSAIVAGIMEGPSHPNIQLGSPLGGEIFLWCTLISFGIVMTLGMIGKYMK
jgi:outer membrane protein assembly factor BamD (BamD/ComL family)